MGVAVATAVLSMASVFAIASPASALQAPGPVNNLTAVGGTNQITVKWDPPTSGSGDNPTDYVISTEKQADPPGTPFKYTVVPETGLTTYTAVVDGLPAGTYRIIVWSHNNSPAPFDLSTPVIVNNVVVTTTSSVVSTAPFRPYANWDALIKREYQMWTGCNATGRLPRLDELTFWRYQIATRPFNADEVYETQLHNGTFYQYRLANLLYPVSTAAAIPAAYVAPPYALADTNNDGTISVAEYNVAANTAYAGAVNDVYFERRAFFAVSLAEGAEQTDGPAIRLYTAYFKRDVDMGACYWSNQIRSAKMSLLGVSNFFVNSSEFINTYGAYTTDAEEPGTDAAEFVALIYANVLDRDPEAAGFAYWTRQLQSQRKSPAEVMIGFSESSEFKNKRSLSTGIAVGYIHLLGRVPTASDYVFSGIFGLYLDTSVECGFSFWGCSAGAAPYGGYGLYRFLIGTTEYATRAAATT